MYGSCKLDEGREENYPPFPPILSTLNTPNYKLAKSIMPILKPLTTTEFTVKDSFHFAEEFVNQQLDFFMGSFDVDSIFTKILLEETIEICTNELFKESETVKGLSTSEFKELFDGKLYKQIDGVAMGSSLGPTLAKAFLVCHKKSWLERYPLEYRLFYYRGYVNHIFVLLNSTEQLNVFRVT